jgi:predicted amidohydrolase YtcJ
MKIFHGNIISCDKDDSVYSYLIEDKGKIVYVGNDLPSQFSSGGKIIDLGEKALLPSFGEGHVHFSNWAVFNATFDVRSAKKIADLGPIINEYANRDKKAKALLGYGYSRHNIAERRYATRQELDKFYSERPIFIVNYDGHSAIINSKTMELLPEEIKKSRGFHEDTGQLFHEAFFKTSDFITKFVPPLVLIKDILKAVDKLAEIGVGIVHPVEGVGFPKDMDVSLVNMIGKGSQLQFRLFFQTMDVDKVLKRNLPRIGGCFATGLDGCFGAQDAALLQPYSNDPKNKGILFYSDEQVIDFCKKANRAGLQIEMHTIGDAAVVQGVKAIEAALKDFPREDHRHTLLHACLIPPETLKKMVDLKIGISLQPAFLNSPLEPIEYLTEILGPRAKTQLLRKLIDLGIPVNGGSDGPVTTPDPIEGIYSACNFVIPEESVTIQQALKMFTYNVAWTSFDEKERGSLEIGKIADLVLLNKNPLTMDKKKLRELKVEKIYVSGKCFKSGKGLIGTLIGGLIGKKKKV